MKKHILLWGISIICLLSGCAAGERTPQKTEPDNKEKIILTIGTADSGGTMYPVGQALSEVVGSSDANLMINVSASTGSLNNIQMLMSGDVDLGLVSGEIAVDAAEGYMQFQGGTGDDLRAIGAVYTSLSNWIAPADSGIEYVHDLKGKSICLGPENSTSQMAGWSALQVMDIDDEETQFSFMGLGSGPKSVENGELDATHGFAGVPIKGFQQLADDMDCTILRYTNEEVVEILNNQPGYYAAKIPAGTYKGQEEDVQTFGAKCILCVNRKMDASLVYKLTKILDENREALAGSHSALEALLDEDFPYTDLAIKLHPGAELYWKEHGKK